jgi:hypothetical protein
MRGAFTAAPTARQAVLRSVTQGVIITVPHLAVTWHSALAFCSQNRSSLIGVDLLPPPQPLLASNVNTANPAHALDDLGILFVIS